MANRSVRPIGDIHIKVNQLMAENNISIIGLEIPLDMDRKQIARRLDGEIQFKQNEIIALCKLFNVTPNALFGIGENRNENDTD